MAATSERAELVQDWGFGEWGSKLNPEQIQPRSDRLAARSAAISRYSQSRKASDFLCPA